jgi:hypothetical protein
MYLYTHKTGEMAVDFAGVTVQYFMCVTVTVPLILKVWEVIFFRGLNIEWVI